MALKVGRSAIDYQAQQAASVRPDRYSSPDLSSNSLFFAYLLFPRKESSVLPVGMDSEPDSSYELRLEWPLFLVLFDVRTPLFPIATCMPRATHRTGV